MFSFRLCTVSPTVDRRQSVTYVLADLTFPPAVLAALSVSSAESRFLLTIPGLSDRRLVQPHYHCLNCRPQMDRETESEREGRGEKRERGTRERGRERERERDRDRDRDRQTETETETDRQTGQKKHTLFLFPITNPNPIHTSSNRTRTQENK